jgi:hypothetical protein
MKNSEEALEKVLAGMRTCEAPAGMESRILRALEDRASARTGSGWRALKPVWMTGFAFSAAVTCLVCAIGLAGLLSMFVVTHQPGRQTPARVSMNPPAPDFSALRRPGTIAHLAQRQPREASAQPTETLTALKAEKTRHAHSRSRGAMYAASYPAPPLPLTRQERLLLHVAHQGDRGELALLNPDKQLAQVAKEQSAFDNFFEQKPVKAEEPQ